MYLSVVVPTIDRRDNLKVLLKSILDNSIIPDEIIIVEQGDVAKTRELTNDYGGLNIRVVAGKERSLAVARNIGTRESRGEIIFFFDDDMELSVDYIETAVEYLGNNESVLGVTGSFVNNNPTWSWKRWLGVFFCVYSTRARNIVLPSGSYDYVRGKNLLFAQSVEWMQGGNMVLRRKIFDCNFRFNEDFKKWSFGEDVMFSFQINKKYPNSLWYVPELNIKHLGGLDGKMQNSAVLKMKIIYRYIFWKKEVSRKRWWYLFPYIWSQVGLSLLELVQHPSFDTVHNTITCYLFLIRNRKNILCNKIDYNDYIFSERKNEFWRKSIGGKFIFIRIKQFFDNPLFLFHYARRLFFDKYFSYKYIDKYKDFKFLDAQGTLDYIIDNKVSLVRFSDGEIDMLNGAGIYPPDSDWSQRFSRGLTKRLKGVLINDDNKILVAHESPEVFLKSKSETKGTGIIYNMWTDTRITLWRYLRPDRVYGHAHVFVPQHNPDFDWKKFFNFLRDYDVIVVTGNIDKLKDIALGRKTFFVEAGKKNAFEHYDVILSNFYSLVEEEKLNKNEVLVMVSLGPTANILVYDLTKNGYLAWDTGHIFRFAYEKIYHHYE